SDAVAIATNIGGFFLSIISQSNARAIEQYAYGISRETDNTKNILAIMDAVPWIVIVIALNGPIIEEIIIRKIIFGVFYEK
ncbi:CPBP family intramembrane metalloprotease, partial [Bacillus altitudinis]|nr:CPBP family intramembrane metalloprotease [Bacillus altitudinis]